MGTFWIRDRIQSLFDNKVNDETGDIESTIQKCVESLCDELPKEVAAVSVKPTSRSGIAVQIVPRNDRSAQITVYAENGNGTVTLWLGRSTIIEILPDKSQPIVNVVRSVCGEVFAGRFREELHLVDDEVQECVATLVLDGRQQVYRYYPARRPTSRKGSTVAIDYAPYG